MVGGFLGAGKTTAIARVARTLIDAGHRVGLVTNDQAFDLVDTQALRNQGFVVGEVAGACFCCKFEELVSTVERLSQENTPDVILAEPVGSCTDLVATVIEPLRHLHGDRYEIAPLAVLLKPEHARKILNESEGVGFSPQAAYIFLKQLEEADLVAVNKIDKLTRSECDELVRLVRDRFPGKRVLAASARTGEGFDEIIERLTQETRRGETFMEVDYDTYAAGEAELGWLNCKVSVRMPADRSDHFSLDNLLLAIVRRAESALLAADAEPVHLKVLGMSDGATGIANLVSSAATAELSLASGVETRRADLLLNARVATTPETLSTVIERVVSEVGEQFGLSVLVSKMQCFEPARPAPTHRMSAS